MRTRMRLTASVIAATAVLVVSGCQGDEKGDQESTSSNKEAKQSATADPGADSGKKDESASGGEKGGTSDGKETGNSTAAPSKTGGESGDGHVELTSEDMQGMWCITCETEGDPLMAVHGGQLIFVEDKTAEADVCTGTLVIPEQQPQPSSSHLKCSVNGMKPWWEASTDVEFTVAPEEDHVDVIWMESKDKEPDTYQKTVSTENQMAASLRKLKKPEVDEWLETNGL